jgi:hypothetical protein
MAARDELYGNPTTRSAWERAGESGQMMREILGGLGDEDLPVLRAIGGAAGLVLDNVGELALAAAGAGAAAKAAAGIRKGAAVRAAVTETASAVSVKAGGEAASLATRARRFVWDPRKFKTEISPAYWEGEKAAGRSLHHWLFPQRARWVPEGIRNAGFNLLELPGRPVYGKLALNQWMGFARSPRWPLSQRIAAGATEWGIRAAIPAGIYGGYKGGEWVGEQFVSPPDH